MQEYVYITDFQLFHTGLTYSQLTLGIKHVSPHVSLTTVSEWPLATPLLYVQIITNITGTQGCERLANMSTKCCLVFLWKLMFQNIFFTEKLLWVQLKLFVFCLTEHVEETKRAPLVFYTDTKWELHCCCEALFMSQEVRGFAHLRSAYWNHLCQRPPQNVVQPKPISNLSPLPLRCIHTCTLRCPLVIGSLGQMVRGLTLSALLKKAYRTLANVSQSYSQELKCRFNVFWPPCCQAHILHVIIIRL